METRKTGVARLAARLREMAGLRGWLPPWPQWWGGEELAVLLPDLDVRRRSAAGCPRLPLSMLEEIYLGPGPLEELQAIVLEASRREHESRDWRAASAGPLIVSSLDGTLVRVPDTPANRAAFGFVGTGDDTSPFPQLRALTLNDVSTRALLGITHGPSGGGSKAAGEQKLLDEAMEA